MKRHKAGLCLMVLLLAACDAPATSPPPPVLDSVTPTVVLASATVAVPPTPTALLAQPSALPTLARPMPTSLSVVSATYTYSGTLPTPPPDAVWSPDGQKYASVAEGVVVDVAQKKVANVDRGSRWSFWGWLVSGRFAIFTYHNQYANKVTNVFDTQKWEVILRTECEDCSSSDKVMKPWGELPVAASPLAHELLMTNGTVINLLTLDRRDLLSSLGENATGEFELRHAAWSPTGKYIAAVGCDDSGCAIYSANGDGSHKRRLASLDTSDYPRSLSWAADEQSVTLILASGDSVSFQTAAP